MPLASLVPDWFAAMAGSADVQLHFRLSFPQRKMLLYLARNARRVTLNHESEAVRPHWEQIEALQTMGAVMIVDIVGSTTRKEITLTDVGANLVTMIKERNPDE